MTVKSSTSAARYINWATTILLLFTMARLFTTPLRATDDLLAYAQDDFYYYLVVAQNMVKGLGSTFDGRTLSNGYHPLYLLFFWVMCHAITSLRGIFKLLAVLDTVSAMAIFLGARAFFARRTQSVWLTNGLALLLLSLCLSKLYHQMEVTLSLPLGILFLLLLEQAPERLSACRFAGAGVVAALLVLSRLDALLLVGLCGAVALSIAEYRRAMTWQKVLAFTVGFAPLIAAYLVTNELYFHRLTPISGAAKQMKLTHGLSWPPRFIDVRQTEMLFALSMLALLYLFWVWGRLEKEQRVVYASALIFPFLHWGLNLLLSDWQLWPWYAYSLRFAMLAALALTARAIDSWPLPRMRPVGELLFFALCLLFVMRRHYMVGGFMRDIAVAARGISAFALTHPGLYAMGDRAGMVGYLNGQPTMQTEGLMMNSAYLLHIQRQEPLREVLKLYHVDYYVGFSEKMGAHWAPVTGCFHAREPAQAGPASPAMQGLFCEHPVWELLQPSGQTMIFDLRAESELPAP